VGQLLSKADFIQVVSGVTFEHGVGGFSSARWIWWGITGYRLIVGSVGEVTIGVRFNHIVHLLLFRVHYH
jgi:hypothetical protein